MNKQRRFHLSKGLNTSTHNKQATDSVGLAVLSLTFIGLVTILGLFTTVNPPNQFFSSAPAAALRSLSFLEASILATSYL